MINILLLLVHFNGTVSFMYKLTLDSLPAQSKWVLPNAYRPRLPIFSRH